MGDELVGDHERRDIHARITRVLTDLGNPEPPLSLPSVRELLRLDLKYYSTDNTTYVQELAHKLRVAGKQVLARPMILFDAIKKAKLCALWVPDSKRILIDETVPSLKHRWIEAHEIGHSIIPWHREFLFGDDEFTLDPDCHAMIEAEANYGAARLLFLQDKFGTEAREMELSFSSIKSLSTRYGNTITSTLWRIVEEREPEGAVFGMISAHPRHPEIGATEGRGGPIRHFIRSAAFRKQFSNITPEDAFAVLRSKASWKKRGQIVDSTHAFTDVNGEEFEFRIESFSNGYALLTFGVAVKKRAVTARASSSPVHSS
jgi:hypothetical protein